MTDFKQGWAEQMGVALASKDEGVRAEAIGLPRLQCFRRSAAKNYDSCRRGGAKAALSRAAKRKLLDPGLTAGKLYVQLDLGEDE